MGCIAALVALLFPRIMIIVLWLFTNWFEGVFDGVLIPVLGFIFLPVTTLWYSVVVNSFGGVWSVTSVVGMVVAIAIDLGSAGGGWRSRRRR
jgi:hypothetical protein